MINRILIRIKVLQIVFAFYHNGNNDLSVAENELLLSLRRSYDLYHYFLLLIVEITHLHEHRLDMRKQKYLPTEEDLHPNTRLTNNRFARQVETNEMLHTYIKKYGITWANDTDVVKKVLEIILASDIYTEYLNNPVDTYEADREFWRSVFRHLICGNAEIEDELETISIYWNDDVEIIETFLLKTIKRFDESKGSRQELLPMFKDAEDAEFAQQLFHKTIQHDDEYRQCIDRHTKNWESERVADMDMIIMQVALAELLNFPKIPVSVTLNEYIDAAKFYSTPKSSQFINGVLDAIVKELRNEKLLLKN